MLALSQLSARLLAPSRLVPDVRGMKMTLSQILRMENLAFDSEEKIKSLWRVRHQLSDNMISCSYEPHDFRMFEKNFKLAPRFVVPLPKQGGYQTFYVEAQVRTLRIVWMNPHPL
jgi:hypothetical protein